MSQPFSAFFAWQLLASLSMVHPVPGEHSRLFTHYRPAALGSRPNHTQHSAAEIWDR